MRETERGFCLWKSVIILIKRDLSSFVDTKEKFKRDQKGFATVSMEGTEKVFDSLNRLKKLILPSLEKPVTRTSLLEILVTSNANQSASAENKLKRFQSEFVVARTLAWAINLRWKRLCA